jgi:hypothetical protein
MTKPIPVPQRIDDYVRLLESGTPFTHANIGGDGEFMAITGMVGTNSDGRAFNAEVGAELAKVLLEPRLTFHGYNPGGREDPRRTRAEKWLRTHGINVPVQTASTLEDPEFGKAAINVRWVHKEIISSANVRGELGPFIRALKKRTVIVVANNTVAESFIADVLGAVDWLLVPPDTGIGDLDEIEQQVSFLLGRWGPGFEGVLTWSLGYPTKVLAWRIAQSHPGVTQIDMGACWDPYSGVLNRHGYRRPEWKAAMETNLREAME